MIHYYDFKYCRNCSSYFNPDSDIFNVSNVDELFKPRLFHPLNMSTIRLLNVGSGTTGTRGIFNIMCEKYGLKSLHYAQVCNVANKRHRELYALKDWLLSLRQCTRYSTCPSTKLFADLFRSMEQVGGTFEFITDSPVDALFIDLLTCMLQSKSKRVDLPILITLRDPEQWVRRRLAVHSNTLICHPLLWGDEKVRHAFDLVGKLFLSFVGILLHRLL
jgi:hypothetical protein